MSAHLLMPMDDRQTSVWHLSPFVVLPVGCAAVRATVSPAASMRESPQLACELRLVFRDSDGNQIMGSGCGISPQAEFPQDQPTPVTGHEDGQQPGVFPSMAGPFSYVMEQSLGIEQPPFARSAGVEFRLSHQQAIYVSAAVTIEAFDADGNLLEIV